MGAAARGLSVQFMPESLGLSEDIFIEEFAMRNTVLGLLLAAMIVTGCDSNMPPAPPAKPQTDAMQPTAPPPGNPIAPALPAPNPAANPTEK